MNKKFFFVCLFAAVVLAPRSSEAITIVIANDSNSTFEGTSLGTNPSNGQETSEFNLQAAYQNLFGQPSPNELPRRSTWGETPTALSFGFRAEGNNVKVNTFQEFDFDIFGNYWTLDAKLTFNPSSAVIVDPNDHILFQGTLQHFGKFSTNDFPHEGDDMKGPLMSFSIDLSAGDKEPATIGQLAHALDAKIEEHPSIGHRDALLGIMQARVVSPSIFFDEIEGSYTGTLLALHVDGQDPVVPEPGTWGLFAVGIAGLVSARGRRASENRVAG